MLDLVFAHGDDVCAEDQNVGGHQNGIGEEAVVGRNALGDFVLVAVRAFEQSHGGVGGERPVELEDLVDVALDPEGRFDGIDAERQKVRGGLQGQFRQPLTVVDRRHGVVVGNEGKDLLVCLGIDHGLDGPEVVADMEVPGGLDTRQNSHVLSSFVAEL